MDHPKGTQPAQAAMESCDAERRAAPERSAVGTCPNCGQPLVQRSCKLVCPSPGCGYFLSCSDYL